MACRNAYKTKTVNNKLEIAQAATDETVTAQKVSRLLFGVDSKIQSNDLLQNNIDMYEWVIRNKVHPNFWGRNITGEDALTKDEIKFLHGKGCKIAAIYSTPEQKNTEEQGKALAKKMEVIAYELGIPKGTAIFMEIGEDEGVTREYIKGLAKELAEEGYTAGFKVNTDARYGFDREFSRGIQTDKDVFSKCLIWAVAPTVAEFDQITTTHLIHPDNWKPYAPSGITRNEISVWQYGKDCHPIEDDNGKETMFNLNLVRNEQVIIQKMF